MTQDLFQKDSEGMVAINSNRAAEVAFRDLGYHYQTFGAFRHECFTLMTWLTPDSVYMNAIGKLIADQKKKEEQDKNII